MKVVLFCGPTLPAAEIVERLPGAEIRRPAEQGDVLEAVLDGATQIGLIDGYFETMPAVWHKEILWALAKSVPVFGAASMGALRAAELYSFGMIGIGGIFEAYRDGCLVDDDEVAMVHGPMELGYPALSVAMVDLRARLAEWCGAGLLTPELCAEMEAQQKKLHFSRRGYESLAAAFPKQAELIATGPTGKSRKAADARALLAAMAQPIPKRAGLRAPEFEETFHWAALRAAVEARRHANTSTVSVDVSVRGV